MDLFHYLLLSFANPKGHIYKRFPSNFNRAISPYYLSVSFNNTFKGIHRRINHGGVAHLPSNWPSPENMSFMQTFLHQCPVGFNHSVKFSVSCCSIESPVSVVNGNVETKSVERNEIRLGLPSKGRMSADTLDLLKVLFIHSFTEVWFDFDFDFVFVFVRIVNCLWGKQIRDNTLQRFLRSVYLTSNCRRTFTDW